MAHATGPVGVPRNPRYDPVPVTGGAATGVRPDTRRAAAIVAPDPAGLQTGVSTTEKLNEALALNKGLARIPARG